jgi:RNA polymerase sigma-70 factor, ECF subfamily
MSPEPKIEPESTIMVSEPVTDTALMRLVSHGDRRAFSMLVERHLGRAMVIVRGFDGLAGDAEDIAQEAFSRVWIKAPKWVAPDENASLTERQASGQASFTTWFQRIVVNLCIDRQRRLGKSRGRRFIDLETAPMLVDEAPDPARHLLQRERDGQVRLAIDALPERQRLAITLCAMDGYSNADAASIMGVHIKALEGLLVRARRHLRQHLQGVVSDDA